MWFSEIPPPPPPGRGTAASSPQSYTTSAAPYASYTAAAPPHPQLAHQYQQQQQHYQQQYRPSPTADRDREPDSQRRRLDQSSGGYRSSYPQPTHSHGHSSNNHITTAPAPPQYAAAHSQQQPSLSYSPGHQSAATNNYYMPPQQQQPSQPYQYPQTQQQAPLPPPRKPVLRTVDAVEYTDFLKRQEVHDMQLGLFVLPTAKPFAPPASWKVGDPVVVDLEKWNNYWAAFSKEVFEHEEKVTAFLQQQEHCVPTNPASSNTTSAASVSRTRRSLIIKTAVRVEFIAKEQFQQHIIAMAVQFGVIESLRIQQDEVRLQFTTAAAAVSFGSFIRTLEASAILPSELVTPNAFQQQQGRINNTARPTVFLVDQKPPIQLTTLQHQQQSSALCTRLIIGPNVDIPSVFLNALFKDIFEATSIDYHAGNFVVDFPSYDLCKFAVHTLQQSFRQIFGITLGFYDVQMKDFFLNLVDGFSQQR